ncbi:MAG: ATP-grasp domain-containing protein, partial [Alphaproteobacteria bacterium]|nr:ATP-grasp domain-containing protein [Alphaproteobacteria bacterium]
MSQTNLPKNFPAYLIVAHSGRMLAEAACQNRSDAIGVKIAVIDLFGDDDLDQFVVSKAKLPSDAQAAEICDAASAMLAHLSPFQALTVVFGSLDLYDAPIQQILTEFLSDGAAEKSVKLRFLGNDARTRNQASDIRHILRVMDRYGAKFALAVPPTQFSSPDQAAHPPKTWLRKPLHRHGGGYGINWAEESTETPAHDYYWQKYIAGRVFGVNFVVSHPGNVTLLGLVENFTDPTQAQPMRWGGVAGWMNLGKNISHDDTLPAACRAVNWPEICRIFAGEFGLLGLNGMDILATETGEIFVLEINPRPTAALGLWRNHQRILWRLHSGEALCQEMTSTEQIAPNYGRAKAILYAEQPINIVENFAWPSIRPPKGSVHANYEIIDRPPLVPIAAGQPICTIMTTDATPKRAWQQAL